MVGVPRSKGCRICVQRRVKCDQTKPTCNNCKKGNRPCPGYGQDLKFQDEGARLRRRFEHTDPCTPGSSNDSTTQELAQSHSSLSASTQARYPVTLEEAAKHDEWDVVALDINQSKRRTFLGLLEGKTDAYAALSDTMPEITSFKVHNTLDSIVGQGTTGRYMFDNFNPSQSPAQHLNDPVANQKAMVYNLHHSLYPDNVDPSLPKAAQNHARWLEHLPPLTGTNPLLDAAVRAVTLVHIGRLNGSEAFVMESRPYYGQALTLLNKALRSKSLGMSNETLCAVILLSFYEMFASDNNEAWVRHAGGVSALMRARGPHRHRTGLDREIFLAYRFTLIIEAFQQDVPCFLAEPGWLKLSRDVHEDVKRVGVPTNRAEIFDVSEEYYASMVVLPALCADARSLWQAKQKGLPAPLSRAQLIEKMGIARMEFRRTFERFEAALKRAGHAPTINLSNRDPLIGIEYWFVNTFVSSSYIGYWTVSIVLNLCLQGLHRDDAEMCQLYRTESKECALNICRSAAFMLTSSFLGPFFLIFGLRVGLLVFEDIGDDISREADWILRKLFEIGDKHMGIAKHIPGYETGMTVEELIQTFRQKREESHKSTEQDKRMEFKDHIARGPTVDTPGTTSSGSSEPSNAFGGPFNGEYNTNGADRQQQGHVNAGWQGINQLDEVTQAWEDQDNFDLRASVGNLNLLPSSSTSRSSTKSPQPPVITSGQQQFTNTARSLIPDMSFADPFYGMDSVDMQDAAMSDLYQDSSMPMSQQSPATFYSSEGQPTPQEMRQAMEGFSRTSDDMAAQGTLGQQRLNDRKATLPRGLERFFS